MSFRKYFSNKQILYISPWFIAGSVCLMTLIVVILAVNNLKRETELLNNGLSSRGQAIGNFIAAGTRTSMMHGTQGALHLQSLVEQISDYPDILYVAVIDEQGRVMSHSDPKKVGCTIDRDMAEIFSLGSKQSWHVVHSLGPEQPVFEVVSDFSPFYRGSRRKFIDDSDVAIKKSGISKNDPDLSGSHAKNCLKTSRTSSPIRIFSSSVSRGADDYSSVFVIRFADDVPQNLPYDWCNSFVSNSGSCSAPEYKILVGLDMKEQARISRQARLHIFSLSIILLLVGFCGWVTLFIAQSYQTSQRALKNIEAFTNLLVLKLPVGIIATEKSGRIKTCNKAIAKMIGKDCGDAVGCYPREILPPILAELFAKCNAVTELMESEIEFMTEEGGRFVVHVNSSPIIDNDGTSVGKVVMLHDLTVLKNLEKEVTKHDRLVALGKMAAGVAHEVRNPLSSIKGFATLLGSNFQEGSEGKNASLLLVKEVERLNRSITELLNYSRPLPLKETEVTIKEFMESSLQLMRSDAVELAIDIDLDVADGIPAITLDRDKINQVLLNLYLNSFQAMPDGGKLVVEVRPTADGKGLCIKVKDSGSGIDEKYLGRVMDPYFTTKAEGTGLGLALAYKIIDEHGGAVKFESVNGQGATVSITLPFS